MNRDKVLELAREAELARQIALEVPFVVDRLERFAALVEREVRGDFEKDRIDAECFRFWVSEAARSPSNMARLIARCTTEEEYRAVIMPCVEAAKLAIVVAKG